MILKPSQQASLQALHIAELVTEAGFPPGVINFVLGDSSVGRDLVTHPGIAILSFTVSTEVRKYSPNNK